MKIIAVYNQKGGIGKTTATVNLGAALAKMGKNVLLFDFDPQGNTSDTMRFTKDPTPTTTNELLYFHTYGMPCNIDDFIRHNELEGLDYIPASPSLLGAHSWLQTADNGMMVLHNTLKMIPADKYDICLIDCKGDYDMTTKNALAASDFVIIPIQPEEYAINAIADLYAHIEDIRENWNKKLSVCGIFFAIYDKRRKMQNKTYEDDLYATFKEMFTTKIPYSTDAPKAATHQRSSVKANDRVGKAYIELAKEVLGRI